MFHHALAAQKFEKRLLAPNLEEPSLRGTQFNTIGFFPVVSG